MIMLCHNGENILTQSFKLPNFLYVFLCLGLQRKRLLIHETKYDIKVAKQVGSLVL
jgi:hypothetical protein